MWSKRKGVLSMKRLLLIFVLLVALCLTACGEPAATETPNTTAPTASDHYTIKVQDAQGNPIVGALVVMCQGGEGGVCYMPSKTGTDGVVVFAKEAVPVQDNMKVRVLSAEGYDLPLDDTGDIRYTLVPDGTTEMTLVLEKTAE
jgi:hypothetical protein